MEDRSDTITLRSLSRASRHSYTPLSPSQDDQSPPSPLLQPGQANEDDPSFNRPTAERHQDGVFMTTPNASPSARLHRSAYILILVLLYMGLALFAWIVTCILAFRPITVKHYGLWSSFRDDGDYGWGMTSRIHSLYVENENWYHAARVIQSIVSVLTVPLTSAVCSSAAVVFVQRHRSPRGLSVRQVMTLADKGWTALPTYARTFPFFASDGWKRYGSSFLLLAMLVNVLGALIAPLQQIFLTTKTIKAPTWPTKVDSLLDIPDQWGSAGDDNHQPDPNLIVVMTRSALTTATNSQRQAQLWQGAGFTCNAMNSDGSIPLSVPFSCTEGGVTFGNMSTLEDPFLAELPSGYGTGLVRQFIPRINSTAQYQAISEAEYPTGCDKIPGAFFVDYSSIDQPQAWGLQACMPANLTQSPWRPTRDRQDFCEELYLNVTLINYEGWGFGRPGQNYYYYKVTLNTTAGYFELPNYMNGGVAGPLLDKDPNDICGHDCLTEGWGSDIYDHNSPSDKTRRQTTTTYSTDASLPLELVVNKGPLLTIALALFGEGSFVPTRMAHPEAYAGVTRTNSTVNGGWPIDRRACVDIVPLGFLLADQSGGQVMDNTVDFCITNDAGGANGSEVYTEIVSWIGNFNYDPERLTNAFNAAGFLANQAWMENNIEAYAKSLTITYDLGADTEVPVISVAGVILISVLLGLDMAILLALACYASFNPRWTSELDAFAMMRIGACIADRVPLLIGRRTDKIKVLDEIPGWIGDQAEENEAMGMLGLGARGRLKGGGRRYACYSGDDELVDYWERKKRERERKQLAR